MILIWIKFALYFEFRD